MPIPSPPSLVNELAEPLSILQVLSQQDPRFEYSRLKQHQLSDTIDVFEAMLRDQVLATRMDYPARYDANDVRRIFTLVEFEGH